MIGKQFQPHCHLIDSTGIIFIPFIFLFFIFFNSCSTSKCTLCNIDNHTIYKVELNEGKSNQTGRKEVLSYFPPIPVEAEGKKVIVYMVDCDGKEPYRLTQGKELQQFVKENLLVVDSSSVKRISKTSDADIRPETFYVKQLLEENQLDLCRRFRSSFKTELRMMVGFRNFKASSYQAIPGDTPIEKKVLGFGEEGTKINLGTEFAFLPTIWTINGKHRLNIGPMIGYWPVDGGNFIPLSIHPRFTFNDVTNPLGGNCNALYLFGDLGTAYDVSGKFDKFWSDKLNSYFWDLGGGFDFWITRKMDISLDGGYRRTSLALPSVIDKTDWLNCIQNHNIPWSGYPVRLAGQFFIRIGVTF